MKIYKFIPENFSSQFEQGIIRISPAHTFREADGAVGGRADAAELTMLAKINGGEETVSSNHPFFDGMISGYVNGVRQSVPIVISGESVASFEDALLFCASTAVDAEVRIKMKESFAADAVFEIEDAKLFTRLVSEAVQLRDYQVTSGAVTYLKNGQQYDSVSEAAAVDPFVKRKEYGWQKEYRIAWRGPYVDSPFNLSVPAVKGLLKRRY
jgi:hypothetical protein